MRRPRHFKTPLLQTLDLGITVRPFLSRYRNLSQSFGTGPAFPHVTFLSCATFLGNDKFGVFRSEPRGFLSRELA
jgi:hypothetical protein